MLLHAPWGSGAAELGRRVDPESVPEGPMSFFVDGSGIAVLDNVNRRIARFDRRGQPRPPLPLANAAAQDLVRGADGRTAVLDRLRAAQVTIFDGDGQMTSQVPLRGPGVPDPASITGLFSDVAGNFYVEREHGAWIELADAAGHPLATRPTAPGRPLPDGRFAAAAIADRALGTARLRLFGEDGTPQWEHALAFGAPILFLALLDGDAAGDLFLGAHVGHESPAAPYRVTDETLVLVKLSPNGAERARLALPAPPPLEESFRDLRVGKDGTVYWMRRTPDGVVIEAYQL